MPEKLMPYVGGQAGIGSGTPNGQTPTYASKKSVSYVASGTDSNQIISISGTDSSSATKVDIPSAIEVVNTGVVPAIVYLNMKVIVMKIQMQEGIVFKQC